MSWVRSEASYGLRSCVLGLAAAAALVSSSHSADAGHRHRYRVLVVREAASVRHRTAESYSPLFASIVVDGNSGAVLHAANADALRHPASLTKIMTLYLLFERLDAGRIRLDAPLNISEHAAEQAPTKLGLKPGHTIAVEDAIKAVVTKSANDAAVAIAENLAGGEEEFAKAMTQKARALGMNRTIYVNASGLPDDGQVTTARDQALLGRAIQERFPRYYRYFSTEEFVYHGNAMRNHNHLLGVVGGVDGIKTGYTRGSGFNLVTSVHRDGHYIVAVVLGGHSASERDARMRELIGDHIKEAASRRTAPLLAERTEPRGEAPAAIAKVPPSSHAEPTATASMNAPAAAGTDDPIQPRQVKTVSYRTAPVGTTSFAPMPALVAVAAAPQQPAAFASVRAPLPAPVPAAPSTIIVASNEPAPLAAAARVEPAKPELTKPEATKANLAKAEAAMPQAAVPHVHARGGWLVQVGAFDGEDEARQHLSAAQLKVPAMLATAEPFTERVQKGDKALYRARFAGFDKAAAEATCKLLKRSDIDCMALKN
jgi:D-alanyl-D-alanine carboxypeptidase